MKAILALLTITALVGTALYLMQNKSITGSIGGIPVEIHDLYKKWQQENGKMLFGAIQDDSKIRTFYQNHLQIEAHNSNPLKTFSMKLNHFADMTVEEFKQFYLNTKAELKQSNNEVLLTTTGIPDSVDWRKEGAVRDVKDQGQCGSCWSFSTTGSLEGLQSIKKLGNDVFAEQQLVDCSVFYGNLGCHGGMMDRAFKYVMKHGITTEDKYPYKASFGFCKQNSGDFKITGFTDVKSGDVDQLAAAVAQQPVSVALDASKWQFYESGIFSDCVESLDHGVLLVGYTSDAWIVKNSWSTKWGESGYIRLKRGNTCGLANTASYPTM